MKPHRRIATFLLAALLGLPVAAADQEALSVEGIAVGLDASTLTLQLWNGEERKFKCPKALEQLQPGALVRIEKVANEDDPSTCAKVSILGGSLVGTIKEIAADESSIVVGTRQQTVPAENWNRAALDRPTNPTAPEVIISLQIGNDLRPLVTEMRPGDGIRAVYKRDGAPGLETNHAKTLEWQSESVGQWERWGTLFIAAFSLFIVALLFTSGHPTHLFLGLDNRYSSSKFQTVLWFWVVSAYLAIVSQRIFAAGWSYIGGVNIPQNLLILSGISVLTFAASKAITTGKVEDAKAKGEDAKPPASAPKPGDLVNDDLNRTDLGDFQMVVITGLAVVFYAISTVAFMEHIEFRRIVTMRDVDATLLAILGLAQAAYLGKKAAGEAGAGMTPDQAVKRAAEMGVAVKTDADKALAAQQKATAKQGEAKAALNGATAATGKAAAQSEADKAQGAADAAGAAQKEAAAAAEAAETKVAEMAKIATMWSKDTVAGTPTKESSTKAQGELSKAKKSAVDAAKAAEAAKTDATASQGEVAGKTQP